MTSSRSTRGRAPALQVKTQPLSARTLAYWRDRLPVPAYDRDLVTARVVHFGVGGFHRAHQALDHDRLTNEGAALDWGICGAGAVPAHRRKEEAVDSHGRPYTLLRKDLDGAYEA